MRAASADTGFATASVMVTLTGLAVVAVALVSFSLSALQHANRELDRERLKSALEEAAYRLLPEIVEDMVEAPSSRRINLEDRVIDIEIGNEQAKIDLNGASREDIETALEPLGNTQARRIAERALEARDGDDRAILDLNVFAREIGLSAAETVCLRGLATTVSATTDPLEDTQTRRTQMAGAIYDFRARSDHPGAPDLGFEMTLLVTGMEHDPVWILWQRYERVSLWERCDATL